MELTEAMRSLLFDTANSLHGAARRRFMAQTVDRLDLGQRQAQLLLGWSRDTVRKGLRELHAGITCLDAFRCAAVNPSSSICHTCVPISRPSSRSIVRPTRPFRPRAATVG